jgi:hypothetical protein
MFAAVSYWNTAGKGRVAVSKDGLTWSTKTTPADEKYWTSICWSPELHMFAAVAASGGDNNRVMTSVDGIIWTERTVDTAGAWSSICWSKEAGRFCAVE